MLFGCISEMESEAVSEKTEIKKRILIKPGAEKGKDSTFGLYDPQFSNHDAIYIDGYAWTILSVRAVCRSVFEFDLGFVNDNIMLLIQRLKRFRHMKEILVKMHFNCFELLLIGLKMK